MLEKEQLIGFTNLDKDIFNQLIKNSFDMIVLLDQDGVQQYVSESCERILGFKPSELVNIDVITEMVHPADQEKTLLGLTDILTKSANGGAQYRHKHKNGGWVYLEAFGTNQIDNPLIRSVVLNVRDITERKKVEEDLKESKALLYDSNKSKDRLFSIIGHDLRTPFNNIMGFSELILESLQNKDYESLEKYANVIKDSSNRAVNLLSNLLEWSQAPSGKIEFNPENFDIVAAINEVVELLEDSAKQKSIHLLKTLPDQIIVLGDHLMLKTVLRNLISNAIKFTNLEGAVIISAQETDSNLTVTVSDNGIGIKKEFIDNLFRIESKYSTLGTNKEKGTGLGLILCKELIDKHKGSLEVESEEGHGSVFKFSLPLN